MLDKAKSIFSALNQARSASSIIADGLNEIREEIERLKMAREDILELPVSQAVAIDRATATLQMQIADARQLVTDPSTFSLSPSRWRDSHRSAADYGAIALAYLGPQIVDAAIAAIKSTYDGTKGVGDLERQKLLDENELAILNTELAEEAIIRQAENEGLTIERRIEADPRAVLAHESALS